MGQKNSESDKTKKINESSSSKQLKVWCSNADILTTDKLNELKRQIDCDYPDIVYIAKVKPKNFIRTLSSVEYYINGYNLQAINILDDEGKVCYFILRNLFSTIYEISFNLQAY